MTGVIRVGEESVKLEKKIVLIERISITGLVAVPKLVAHEL